MTTTLPAPALEDSNDAGQPLADLIHQAGGSTDSDERIRRAEDVVNAFAAELDGHRANNLGFPAAFDIDYSGLSALAPRLLNNLGDPFSGSAFPAHSKLFERRVVELCADLFRAPPGDRWGFVTSGGYAGIEYGLLNGQRIYPKGIVYYSDAAHASVPAVLDQLGMTGVAVAADQRGALDPRDLAAAVHGYRDRPAIVVATVGTTMTEAVDDIPGIRTVLREARIYRAYIHADAALSGFTLALLPPDARPGFDMADGADSISASGHKFLGTPMPCGVLIVRASARIPGHWVDYLDTSVTLANSRSGHAPLHLWWALDVLGLDRHRQRAHEARETAIYAVDRLKDIGWPAWRHLHGMTVVIDRPTDELTTKWHLAASGQISHLMCMPGITRTQIDALCADLAALKAASPARAASGLPRQMRRAVPPPDDVTTGRP
ncbi:MULTISPECIES: histidine decarboxylase [Asanoa]|uniref:Histidine decarboxylase n=2 Tax=Asanoa TaxID=195964 RepID=A0A239PIV3_9ACTN|nr:MULTISPECIES: histidine decarboxylase [Asanoa]GIF74233.1 histidine decarboxylase [Asanoa siamensis]SNT66269.1 histidine decarboxylase [Asanoa hainanensis]